MTRLAALAMLAFLGAGSEQGALPEPAADANRCLALPEARDYLDVLRTRVYARWAVPAATPRGGRVRIEFELQRTGALAHSVADPPGEPLTESALTALRSAAPFAPLDPPIDCLAGRSLRATFTTP